MLFDILVVITLIALFGVFHSYFASQKVKKNFVEKTDNKIAFYRILFSFFSVLMFLAILIIIPKNSTVIYDLPTPWDLVTYAIQMLGLIGIIWTGKSFDGKEFLGLSQIKRYFKGDYNSLELDEHPNFRTNGAVKYSRHPAYFYTIVFMGFRPFMDLTYFVLFISITTYFIVGAKWEEEKLVLIYGDVYKKYQKEVPKFIPFGLIGIKKKSVN
jgi:protein-S-isoprenylcysteine O-methyltransferase Ste14